MIWKKKRPKFLGFEHITIPPLKIERTPEQYLEFKPSRIESLADATQSMELDLGYSHAQMPRLSESTPDKVKFVSLVVRSYEYGGSCPTLNREDYEILKERCLAEDDKSLIGKAVIVIYDSMNRFAGFIAPYHTRVSLTRVERRNVKIKRFF